MTKEEAIKAMQTHRVRHSSWGKNEWCHRNAHIIMHYFNDYPNSLTHIEEFKIRYSNKEYDNGWEIIPNPERSVVKF